MTDLLKLMLTLFLILLMLARRWNLGLVLFLASALVGLLFARPLPDLALDFLHALTAPLTLRLAAVVVLIMMLGEFLRETAGLERMVEGLEGLLPDARVMMALWPAFIGLLPMVGGAMFSAPLVQQLGDRLEATPERRTFVNYWFRHMWEYVFPIYPAFLVGTALLGIPERQATAVLWPLFAASLVGGVLFGLLGVRRVGGNNLRRGWASLRLVVQSGWPVALVLALALALHIDLVISLLVTLVLLALVQRVRMRVVWQIVRHRIPWQTVAVVFGAMLFRGVLEACGAVASVPATLAELGVPVWVTLFTVPFVVGFLTGLGAGAFSIGFPIILPLLSHNPPGAGEVAWAWAGGFLGVMMSPMHLCLALTREYFQADWGRLYRRLVPAMLLVMAVAGGMLVLL